MRFLSHLLAAILAVVALAPTLDAGLTPTRATATHQASTAVDLADAQPPVLDEDDPRWVCWAQGNRECSSVPLDGPGDGPAGGQTSGPAQVRDVLPLCVTDAQCDELGLAGDVMWT